MPEPRCRRLPATAVSTSSSSLTGMLPTTVPENRATGELLGAFEGFEALAHEEGDLDGRFRESLLARRPD